MLSTGIDIPSEVCYNPPSSDWKEKIYLILISLCGAAGCDCAGVRIHGLTKNKAHAEQIVKEVTDSYIEETGWLDPP